MDLSVVLADMRSVIAGLRPQDFGPLLFGILWLVVLLAGLKGVDRRDEVTEFTYPAVMVALGTALMLGLPLGSKSSHSPLWSFLFVSTIFAVSSLRWVLFKNNLQSAQASKQSAAKTKK
jgi:hypothetical protein